MGSFTFPIVYFKRWDKTRTTSTCGFSCVLQLQEADFLLRSLSSSDVSVLSIAQPCISHRDPTCLALLNTEFMVSICKATGSIPRTLTKNIIVNNEHYALH